MLYSLLRPTQGGEKNGQVLSDLRKRPHERQQRQPFRAPHPSPVGSEHAARARCCGRLRLPYERLHSLPAQRQSSARSVKSLNIAEDSTQSQRDCVVFLWGETLFFAREPFLSGERKGYLALSPKESRLDLPFPPRKRRAGTKRLFRVAKTRNTMVYYEKKRRIQWE